MRTRSVVFLAAAAVVALGGGYYLGQDQRKFERPAPATGDLAFPGLAPRLADATRLELKHQSQSAIIELHDRHWGLVDHAFYPVELGKLRALFEGLTELRLTEPRTADPAQYTRLGVEEPTEAGASGTLLRLLDNQGRLVASLIVGHRRVRTQGSQAEELYVRRPGEAQSWLAEGQVSAEADGALWLDRAILNVDGAHVAGVGVERAGAVIEMTRVGDKPVVTAPTEHPPIDDDHVADVFKSLENLSFLDVRPAAQVPGGEIGKSLFRTGDGMSVNVSVFQEGEQVWLRLTASGTADAATLNARIAPWAFQVGAWKIRTLVPLLDDLKAAPPPATSPPATSPPASSQPATSPPATSQPATSQPATSQPATSQPGPSAAPPASPPPASEPPATTPPSDTPPH